MEVYEIFQLLESTNSRNKKISILEENKNNILLQGVLKYALDGNIVFGIKKIPEYDDTVDGVIDLDMTLGQIREIHKSGLSGNKLIETMSMILENSVKQERKTIEKIISKDLKCGVSKSTVNKVFGKNFISDYPCMLASSYNEKNMKKITFPCLAQYKSDGMRINIVKYNGNLIARTRNGKVVDHNDQWKHIFAHLPNNIIIDGEAIVVKEGVIQSRKVGNGVLNKIIKGTASFDEIQSVNFVFWDAITLTAFENGIGTVPYSERVEILNSMFNPKKFNTFNRVMISRTLRVFNIEEATELFNHAVSQGEEGIILKNEDSVWEDKRSKNLVKMKVENDADLVITDWIEGEGKYEGMLGALTGETSDGKLVVNVGSGFTDDDRKNITKDIVGNVMTVKYNEIISDKNKKTKSLFLPIYVELREDKDTANKLSELK